MKNILRASCCLGAVCLGSCQVRAQDTPTTPSASLSVTAKLVVVPVVVRDKHGALMNGLTKDSFVLTVDGKPQAIRYFDHDNDVPLTLGLLVDTSMSQRTVLDDERAASARFLETMLTGSKDRAYVVQFARTVDLLQDVTDSKPKLQQALQQLDAEARPSFSNGGSGGAGGSGDSGSNGGSGDSGGYGRQGGYGGGRGGPGGGGGTALYDAVFLASDEISAKAQGRRAIILLTDGDDRGSKITLARAIEAAQRADTMVYAIYYKGEEHGGYGGGPGGHHGVGFPGGGFPGGGRGTSSSSRPSRPTGVLFTASVGFR